MEVSHIDAEVIRWIEKMLGPSQAERAVQAAAKIIEKRWETIAAIAGALERRGRLSGREVALLPR